MTEHIYLLGDVGGAVKIGRSSWGIFRVRTCYSPRPFLRFAIAESQVTPFASKVERDVLRSLAAFRHQKTAMQGSTEWLLGDAEEVARAIDWSWFTHHSERPTWKYACLRCDGFGTDNGIKCRYCSGGGYATNQCNRRSLSDEIKDALRAHVERHGRKVSS